MKLSDKEIPDNLTSKSVPMRPVRRTKGFFRFLLLVLSYVIVAAVAWKVAEQWKLDPAKEQVRAEAEVRNTVEKVSKLMILPDISVELPQIAIINDAESLAKTQAFFVDVKNGDQVLIYLKGQKAIIYRASENKIVNVGPVITDNSASAIGTGSNSSSASNSSKPAAQTSSKSAATSSEKSSASSDSR